MGEQRLIVNPVVLKQVREKTSNSGNYPQLRNLGAGNEVFSLGSALRSGMGSAARETRNTLWSEEQRGDSGYDEVHVSERASMRLAKPQGLWEVQSHTILARLDSRIIPPDTYPKAAAISVMESVETLKQSQMERMMPRKQLDIYA